MRPTQYLRDPFSFAGRVEMRPLESRALAGNALGDPDTRELPVYLPPGWDAPGAEFPVIYLLAAFTGRPHKFLETNPWDPGVIARFDRALVADELPPAIVVMPDCFTRLGGSQYVDSSATGAYESYVCQEIVPWVDEHYPTRAGRRSVCGKSSGGFGALYLAMRHPGLFQRVASLSGDVCFELTFGAEILACLRGLVAYGGDPARYLAQFGPGAERTGPDLSGDGHAILNVLAMAACYSPNPEAALGFDLPMDLATGERIDAVWQRWLARDPLVAAAHHAPALRGLDTLYLECGLRDEFHLQWGLRRLVNELQRLEIPCEHVEHPGGHRGLDSRFLEVFERLI